MKNHGSSAGGKAHTGFGLKCLLALDYTFAHTTSNMNAITFL